MNNCLLCDREIQVTSSLAFVFSFQSLNKPSLCPTCRKKFQPIVHKNACRGCSLPNSPEKYCQDCIRWLQKYPTVQLNHIAFYEYNKEAQAYMKQFKYQGDVLLAKVFAFKIQKILKKYEKTHQIVPIPTSLESKKTRGFNQVQLILQEAGISYKDLLLHSTKGKRQASKNRKERMQMKQPFQLRNEKMLSVDPILLVDDVYTTGRTILHARIVLAEGMLENWRKLKEEGYEVKQIKILTCSLFR